MLLQFSSIGKQLCRYFTAEGILISLKKIFSPNHYFVSELITN